MIKAVPPALKSDPGFLFARIQDARRSNRAYEAATLLSLAPTDRKSLINPDKWWSERRMVARELLDLNEPKLAFELCAKATPPDESANRVDLDFHAGWIALRFLGDATRGGQAFRARRRGGRDAAVDRPRRLLARPRRRGDGRCGGSEASLRERGERADRLLRPARRRAARREAARAARAEGRRRGRPSATRRCGRPKRSTPKGSTISRPRSRSRRRAHGATKRRWRRWPRW